MADGLNRFFQNAGNQLNDAIGNPRAESRPGLNDPGHPSNKHVNNRTLAPDGKGMVSMTETLSDKTSQQQPGFTPVEYFKTVGPEWSDGDPEFKVLPPGTSVMRNTLDTYNSIAGVDGDYDNYGDISTGDFKYKLGGDNVGNVLQSFETATNINSFEQSKSRIWNYDTGDFISNHDNEDPIFFGFDIVIDVDASPLLNGALEEFLLGEWSKGLDDEISSRLEIYYEFVRELKKYFRFTRRVDFKGLEPDSIFKTDMGMEELNKNKFYYVKGVTGLEKLSENNTPGKQKAFIEYLTDVLTLDFYEDTTLNMGTLYTLYKSLYWSRLNGKSLCPENLLRFDMRINISELRNFVSVKKGDSVEDNLSNLEILRSNLSKYVYYVYECQFFFDKPTHPDSIDLGSKPTETDKWAVQVSYKHSDMAFIRYNPAQEMYKEVNNNQLNPQPLGTSVVIPRRAGFIENPGDFKLKDISPNGSSTGVDSSGISPGASLDDFAKDQKSSASSRLLNSLKKAALNEAQRQLNTQFSLINNSIDEIRTSFGIGRMPEPTNVYQSQIVDGVSNQFFFDVRNSLRDFGGDTLSGAITGG
jgi:hypothetical protein